MVCVDIDCWFWEDIFWLDIMKISIQQLAKQINKYSYLILNVSTCIIMRASELQWIKKPITFVTCFRYYGIIYWDLNFHDLKIIEKIFPSISINFMLRRTWAQVQKKKLPVHKVELKIYCSHAYKTLKQYQKILLYWFPNMGFGLFWNLGSKPPDTAPEPGYVSRTDMHSINVQHLVKIW